MPLKERPIKIRESKDFTPENNERVMEHYDQQNRDLFDELAVKLQLDANGDLILPGDLRAEDGSLYVSAESLYLGETKISEPLEGEDNNILQVDFTNKLAKWVSVPAPNVHAPSHESGGSDETNHDDLAGFVANEHINMANVVCNNGDVITNNGEVIWVS